MATEVQVVGGEEYVARGRVESEKAELLREIREMVSAGRLEAAGDSSLLCTPTHVPLPTQQHSEIFALLVLALWFLSGLAVLWRFFPWL